MNTIRTIINAHFPMIFFGILLIASVLRFYDYQDRWGLAYDQAHDAIISRYAIETNQIPLLGPFSSAGPFQTGGEWYWIIIFDTALYPPSVLAPWITLTFLSILSVGVLILLGMKLVNKEFGLLAGLLAAFSPSGISQALNLTNQAPLSLTTLSALVFMVVFVKTRKTSPLFLLAFFVSLGSAIHLQGAALIFLIVSTLLVTKTFDVKNLCAVLAGLVIPWIPVAWADAHNHFSNFYNMAHYYLYDQYKISFDVLGRRWLTYLGFFWPQAWSHVTGGQGIFGYLILFTVLLNTFVNFFRKNVSKEWLIIVISFVATMIVIRYTRTPLFDSYLIFLHPFIYLISAWSIYTIFRMNKVLGFCIAIIILVGSMQKIATDAYGSSNSLFQETTILKNVLYRKFPDKRFAIYEYDNSAPGLTLSLTLLLEVDHRISDDGQRIGVLMASSGATLVQSTLYGEKGDYQLLDLSGSTSAQLLQGQWRFFNPSSIYNQTEYWYLMKEK